MRAQCGRAVAALSPGWGEASGCRHHHSLPLGKQALGFIPWQWGEKSWPGSHVRGPAILARGSEVWTHALSPEEAWELSLARGIPCRSSPCSLLARRTMSCPVNLLETWPYGSRFVGSTRGRGSIHQPHRQMSRCSRQAGRAEVDMTLLLWLLYFFGLRLFDNGYKNSL